MSESADQMEFLLNQAARAAGLGDAAALEANDNLYAAWVTSPLAVLDHLSPDESARRLPLPALLSNLEKSARRRGIATAPARIWMEEAVRRLEAEQSDSGEVGKVLAAVAELALLEPETEFEEPVAQRLGLAVLSRWGAPASVPVLVSVLAVENPALRTYAAEVLGRLGRTALPAILAGLNHTRAPELRRALLVALCRMPNDPAITTRLQDAWNTSAEEDRLGLVKELAVYGDTSLGQEIAAALPGAPSRTHWAAYRVALRHLQVPEPETPPPPPAAGDEEEDLVMGAEQLAAGSLTGQARLWVQDALNRLADREANAPETVDWLLFEKAHQLADRLLTRSPELALHRFVDYCFGALHYYGALPLDQLMALVTLAGGMPPAKEAAWAALIADERFRSRSDRTVALTDVSDIDELLVRHEEVLVQPALFPLRTFALIGRGLGHLAWSATEAEAAQAVIELVPEPLARPERVVALQMAMRAVSSDADAFRDWFQHAASHGMEITEAFRRPLERLWDETPRWELFGHTPRAAGELFTLLEAHQQANVGPDDPCPCGSGQRFKLCCGRS